MYHHYENTRRGSLDITGINLASFHLCYQESRILTHFICDLVIQANEAFNTVMSSGRDKRIWVTDLRNPEQRVLLCEASAPVLRLCLSQDMDHVWVATEESSIKRYVSAY